MKIYLRKRSYFTFRGVESYALDLLGETPYSLMKKRLDAEDLPDLLAGDYVLLDPVYPFLTRETLFSFLEGREGSYYFTGGEVHRHGFPVSRSPRIRTDELGQGLFSLGDYPAVLAAATSLSEKIHADCGALVEKGAEISFCSELSEGAIVQRGARLVGACRVGKNAEIGAGSRLVESSVGAGSSLSHSVLDHAEVGEGCTVGPFAYLRAGTKVGNRCRIGDFVELKNAVIGAECKIAHLAYVGDADLGERGNVGCGAVFVNYNGKTKSRVRVGKGCFIGSNCNLIAPLTLGDGAFVAAGTTLTRDLSEEDFCIGRCRETVKPHRGRRYYDP